MPTTGQVVGGVRLRLLLMIDGNNCRKHAPQPHFAHLPMVRFSAKACH